MKFCADYSKYQHKLLLTSQEEIKAPSFRPMPILTAYLLQHGTVVVTEKSLLPQEKQKKHLFLFKGLHKLYSLLPLKKKKIIKNQH